jgi:hypothetical protein
MSYSISETLQQRDRDMDYKIDTETARTKNGSIRVRTWEITDPQGGESSHVQISMDCKELDMTQCTRTIVGSDGKRLKVKKVEAHDASGNSIELSIFFDA